MKTSNFPRNKLRKQKEALERLKRQLSSGTRYKATTEQLKEHIAFLEEKLKGATA